MFCLKWCFEGFLIICDRVAANLKYFRTFVFYKVASVGEIHCIKYWKMISKMISTTSILVVYSLCVTETQWLPFSQKPPPVSDRDTNGLLTDKPWVALWQRERSYKSKTLQVDIFIFPIQEFLIISDET